MEDKTYSEKLKIIDKAIEKAKLEVGFHEKQLVELKPQRDAMESECKEKYNCAIDELPKLLEKNKKKLSDLVDELESDIKTAQGECS